MIGTFISMIGPAVAFGSGYKHINELRDQKIAREKATAHKSKALAALNQVLKSKHEDIPLGPAEDTIDGVGGMAFGVFTDTGLEALISLQEDMAMSRFMRSVFGEYEYTDPAQEFEDKTIIKACFSDQLERGTKWLTIWTDAGLKPAENIILWWLEMLPKKGEA